MFWFDVEKSAKTSAGNRGARMVRSRNQIQPFVSPQIFPFGFVSKAIKGLRGVGENVGANGCNAIFGFITKEGDDLNDGDVMLYAADTKAKIILRAAGDIEIHADNANINIFSKKTEIAGTDTLVI